MFPFSFEECLQKQGCKIAILRKKHAKLHSYYDQNLGAFATYPFVYDT